MIAAMLFNFGKNLRRVVGVTGLFWANPFLATFVHASGNDGPAPYEQCGFCHEYDGNSFAGNYPKIAGMKPRYLMKQLQDYRYGRRNGDGKMQQAAALLSDQDMQVVIAYFAGQKRSPEPALQVGVDYRHARLLAEKGDPVRVIVACNDCHDSNNPAYPTLRGQHAEYIAQELYAFKNNTRSNDDPSIMRYLAVRLSDSEIQRLSEYLAAGGTQQ